MKHETQVTEDGIRFELVLSEEEAQKLVDGETLASDNSTDRHAVVVRVGEDHDENAFEKLYRGENPDIGIEARKAALDARRGDMPDEDYEAALAQLNQDVLAGPQEATGVSLTSRGRE